MKVRTYRCCTCLLAGRHRCGPGTAAAAAVAALVMSRKVRISPYSPCTVSTVANL